MSLLHLRSIYYTTTIIISIIIIAKAFYQHYHPCHYSLFPLYKEIYRLNKKTKQQTSTQVNAIKALRNTVPGVLNKLCIANTTNNALFSV